MGFDCFRSGANNNTILRLDPIESDSLVNDQNLREINDDSEFTMLADRTAIIASVRKIPTADFEIDLAYCIGIC